jgi:uncharacterized membrane protein
MDNTQIFIVCYCIAMICAYILYKVMWQEDKTKEEHWEDVILRAVMALLWPIVLAIVIIWAIYESLEFLRKKIPKKPPKWL